MCCVHHGSTGGVYRGHNEQSSDECVYLFTLRWLISEAGMLGWWWGSYLGETTARSLIFPRDEEAGVCGCRDAHVWLFDRWKQHLFVHSSPDEDLSKNGNTLSPGHTHTHTHTHLHTHTLTRSPEGHLVLHKLALVGWGLSGCKLVRRCISLKVWTRLTLPTVDPSIMLSVSFVLLLQHLLPFSVFSLRSLVFSFSLIIPPPPACPSHLSNLYLFHPPLHLCLPPPPRSLTHPLLAPSFADDWSGKFSAVSLNAAAVAFLYSFIQKAV